MMISKRGGKQLVIDSWTSQIVARFTTAAKAKADCEKRNADFGAMKYDVIVLD